MKRLKFILVIESYIIRKGLSAVLNKIPGIHIIKELNNILQFDQILSIHNPDFIIICETLFSKTTTSYLKNPSLLDRTILIQKNPDDGKQSEVKEIIFLDESKEHLNRKIENLLTPYFKSHNDPVHPELSEREKTIVKFVATGMTNKEIAEKLFLSTHTVITHRKNISRKLNVKSASGLTVYAIVNNIISIDEIAGLNPPSLL